MSPEERKARLADMREKPGDPVPVMAYVDKLLEDGDPQGEWLSEYLRASAPARDESRRDVLSRTMRSWARIAQDIRSNVAGVIGFYAPDAVADCLLFNEFGMVEKVDMAFDAWGGRDEWGNKIYEFHPVREVNLSGRCPIEFTEMDSEDHIRFGIRCYRSGTWGHKKIGCERLITKEALLRRPRSRRVSKSQWHQQLLRETFDKLALDLTREKCLATMWPGVTFTIGPKRIV